MASLVLTDSSQLTPVKSYQTQVLYPYAKPYDLQKPVFSSFHGKQAHCNLVKQLTLPFEVSPLIKLLSTLEPKDRGSIQMSHTIMLIQSGNKPETRTYSDYESVNECMEGVCKIYEEHLKQQNPNTPSITYDISQLFDFIDQVADLSCLVYQKSTNTYAPYNKDWIKEKIYVLLRRQARSQ
uniref:Enhancer of rudimentary homolog n=1 Tax=Timema poppense TaxID=170557 RepID=A0A7R9GZ90_TIMPO|nr:unnamed protein product [Timema poppensis]